VVEMSMKKQYMYKGRNHMIPVEDEYSELLPKELHIDYEGDKMAFEITQQKNNVIKLTEQRRCLNNINYEKHIMLLKNCRTL
jgi:hypothetical protein